MTVERALVWAYRDELPKRTVGGGLPHLGYGSGHAAADMVAGLWCLPDNAFGVVVDPSAAAEPHPDAVAIHLEVLALDDVAVEVNEGWRVPELEAAGAEGIAAVARAMAMVTRPGRSGLVYRMLPSDVLRTAAILGPPDGTVEAPERKVVCDRGRPLWFRRTFVATETGGFEAEVDGFDAKRRRPLPGAYQKFELDPDPVDGLVARARYHVWRLMLERLHERLAVPGRLTEVRVARSGAPWAPWVRSAAGRVLPDLVAASAAVPAGGRKRKIRGGDRGRSGAVAETSCVRRSLGA